MSDKSETLHKFDNAKLIDVVKNYKQYGYDDEIRNTALTILASRGIDEEALRLTGNDKNYSYDTTENIFKSYTSSSRYTILFYVLSLLLKVLIIILLASDETMELMLTVMFAISVVLYLAFLIRSYLKLNDFYKSMNRQIEVGEQIGYFIIGMPLYILVYFFYKSKMKEEMKML